MKITEIKFNPNNPRNITEEKFQKLVQSIKDFPKMLELRPLILDENNMVLGGNMRLKACLEIGLKDVPTIQAKDLTEEQKKEFIIKDNLGFGEWDWELLDADFNLEDLEGWGLEVKLSGKELTDDFQDEGILPKNQFGVIVMCEDEQSQEAVFSELTAKGYKCKVVVT